MSMSCILSYLYLTSAFNFFKNGFSIVFRHINTFLIKDRSSFINKVGLTRPPYHRYINSGDPIHLSNSYFLINL
jgi:hypothetical protein